MKQIEIFIYIFEVLYFHMGKKGYILEFYM